MRLKAGQCHYPRKQGDRVVFCGKETLCKDKSTEDYAMFCSDCQRKFEKALKEIDEGTGNHRRDTIKIKNVTMYDR